MDDDAEEVPQNQIVLHEDKKYYSTALEVCFINLFVNLLFFSRYTEKESRLWSKKKMPNH